MALQLLAAPWVWLRTAHFGIAARLTFGSALVGLVAIGGLAFYQFQGLARAISDGEQASMSATLANLDMRLNARMVNARGDAQFLAAAPQLVALGRAVADRAAGSAASLAPQRNDLAALFAAMLLARPQYASLRFIGPSGNTGSEVRVDRLVTGGIQQASDTTRDTDGDREAVAQALRLAPGLIYSSEFAPAVPAPQTGPAPTAIEMATPAFSPSGTLLGVVVVHLGSAPLYSSIDDQFRGISSVHALATQQGRYFELPDPKGLPRWPGQAVGGRLLDDMPQLGPLFSGTQQPYAGSVDVAGEAYLVSARQVRFDPQDPDRFFVVVEMRSEADLLARIVAVRNQAIFLAAMLLAAGLMVVAWLARLIAAPLNRMADIAGRVAAGERGVDLDVLIHRNDETGDLARSFAHMVQEIGVRETELARQAEELQRSNSELSHFAYVASHDLQEPLRMVASYLELLRRRYQGKLDAEADEFIGYAVDGAARMKGLINALLAYARVSNVKLALQPVDLGVTAQAATKMLAGKIAESGAEITFGFLPSLEADPSMMDRLFTNLIENAIKYRSDAPPKVALSSRAAGSSWEISVTDNGIGIPAEFREKVFEIFARLHGRDKYEGTGIGLTACRRIVERHGGRIWIADTPGGGTTFVFTLPMRQPQGIGNAQG